MDLPTEELDSGKGHKMKLELCLSLRPGDIIYANNLQRKNSKNSMNNMAKKMILFTTKMLMAIQMKKT